MKAITSISQLAAKLATQPAEREYNIAAMETHAHVPKRGSTLKHWVIEGVFIALSVGLGFWVSGIRERNQNKELVERVLRAVDDELAYNLTQIEPSLAFEKKWIANLEAAGLSKDLKSGYGACPTSATACGLFFATRPPRGSSRSNFPILRSAAWQTAAATGALRLMDTQLVAGLSELYQMQELYKSNIDKVGVGSTDWFDPAFHEPAVRKLYLALDELYYDESEILLPLYKRLQPIVHGAVKSR